MDIAVADAATLDLDSHIVGTDLFLDGIFPDIQIKLFSSTNAFMEEALLHVMITQGEDSNKNSKDVA